MTTWADFAEALLVSYPGRFDAEMTAGYVREIQARGATDPTVALATLRQSAGEHPPSAGTLAAAALRHGQSEPPSFDELIAFVARTLASHTAYGSDDSGAYVELVAAELGEAAARWVAGVGVKGLREVPDPRFTLDRGQEIRLRDHAKGYAETTAEWRRDPRPMAVEAARQRDALRSGGMATMVAEATGILPAMREADARRLRRGDD